MTEFRDVYIRSKIPHRQEEFNYEATVVDTTFTSNLESFKTNKIWRITVRLVQDSRLDNYIENLKEVITIYRYFDFYKYWKLNDYERKLSILDYLYESSLLVCKKHNLPENHFKVAYQATIENGIKYSTYWGTGIFHPKKPIRALIHLDFDLNVSEINVVFVSGKREKKINLCHPKPHYMYFDRCLGETFWNEKGEFCLVSKDGKEKYKAIPPEDF